MKHQGGFVMADALIALVLISLLLLSLLGMNKNSAALASSNETRLTAALIAQSILEDGELELNDGTIEVDGRTFDWSRVVTDVTDTNRPRLSLNIISITVRWQDNQLTRKYELKTARIGGVL